jgi:hypothetical protein
MEIIFLNIFNNFNNLFNLFSTHVKSLFMIQIPSVLCLQFGCKKYNCMLQQWTSKVSDNSSFAISGHIFVCRNLIL